MAMLGWLSMRLPEGDKEKLKAYAKMYELSESRFTVEVIRIGLKHLDELGLSPVNELHFRKVKTKAPKEEKPEA